MYVRWTLLKWCKLYTKEPENNICCNIELSEQNKSIEVIDKVDILQIQQISFNV